MARKELVDQIIKLYSKLGGNVNEVLGTRSNISFLGTGRSPEGFIDSTINIDAIGALGKNKVLDELKSSMGYLTADKLNDIQAGKLLENMTKIDEVFNPKQVANIVDLGTGTRNLTEEGLGALRQTRKTDDDFRVIKDEVGPEITPLMSRVEGRMENIKGTSSKLDDAIKEYEKIYKSTDDIPPPGSGGGTNEIDALETMVTNRAGNDFIAGYVTELYKNAGAVSATEVAKKRAAARTFLNTMLKKETDLLPQGGTLESVITPTDYKYITEGGGGVLGDPLVLIKKYFGDTITKRLPLNSDKEIIETFVDNVRFTKDRAGFATDDPRFNPDDLPEFKHGGLAKILEV
jgi:hypothetical protein